MDNTIFKFVEYVKDEVTSAGGTVYMPAARSVTYEFDSEQVNGYWDKDSMTLACAVGQPQEQWLPLLAHEYSHFTQWKDQCEAWVIGAAPYSYKGKDIPFYELMWAWIAGDDTIPSADSLGSLEASRELEADCERRTVKVIEKFGLPIDIKEYSRNANAYVHFYNAIIKFRKWYKIDQEPYNIPEIVKVMPDEICQDFTETPDEWINLFEKHCFDEVIV